ncbi:MAG: hypothetical protein QG629_177 [Patescibacteria group bacterium]|nr:hypothetical protein [Candidatus Saccharibacteria bacterium]MDQ5963095.1 hypothetical protein [Patescibacteria group bacterium]
MTELELEQIKPAISEVFTDIRVEMEYESWRRSEAAFEDVWREVYG